jgi:uncharacterized protein (DUF58 family)
VTLRSGAARRALRRSWLFARLSREGRVVFAMAALGLPLSLNIGQSQTHQLVIAALALLVASLVSSRLFAAGGLSVAASAPQRVTLGDELCVALDVDNASSRELRHLRTEPPALGFDGRAVEMPADIERLAPGARSRLTARLRFQRRGAHHLDPFRVAQLLPFGLARGAASESLGTSFLVVPRVARVTRVGAARARRHQPAGIAGASRIADATDLAGVRPYRPGDLPRDLHARSWARHGEPMVRQYREEWFTRIGVVIDTDAAEQTDAAFEAALSLVAGIVARLCEGEALVDVLVTGDRTERLSLGRHTVSLERALDMLATLQRSPGFDGERLHGQLRPHLDGLSCVLLVALGWDETRSGFLARLEARGVATLAYLLSEQPAALGPSRGGRVIEVPLGAITRGEELAL